jgi:hypothetical protein
MISTQTNGMLFNPSKNGRAPLFKREDNLESHGVSPHACVMGSLERKKRLCLGGGTSQRGRNDVVLGRCQSIVGMFGSCHFMPYQFLPTVG